MAEATHPEAGNETAAAARSGSTEPMTAGASSDSPEPVAPPPEPMTPERAAAENRRNDRFIAAGALVAAFLFGFFKINDPNIWLHLRSGWHIHQIGIPAKDPFAYTTADKDWINPHWLFDWAAYYPELIESRSLVRGLADDYRKLLTARLTPKYDESGKDVTKLPAEQEIEQMNAAVTAMEEAARGSDTSAMRGAAQRAADTALSLGLEMPSPGQSTDQAIYPALYRYVSSGGTTLVTLRSLVVVKALLLVAIAGIFLSTRHQGPTLWCASFIAAIVLVAMSDRLTVTPEVFSLLFLAATLCIVHQFQHERVWPIFLLVPLMIAWVNIDGLFPLGIMVPAVVLLSNAVSPRPVTSLGRPPSSSLGVLGAATSGAVLATFVNPFGMRIWSVPIESVRAMLDRGSLVAAYFARYLKADSEWAKKTLETGDFMVSHTFDYVPPISREFSYFAFPYGVLDFAAIPVVFCVALAGLAVGSLFLNGVQGRIWRGLLLAIAVAMFLFASRYIGVLAVVAGVVLMLSGQEWFRDRFGGETRITSGWLVWSQGGRAATILSLAGLAIIGMTGRFGAASRSEFGWGVLWAKCDFSAAKFLDDAALSGNVLNSVPIQGNMLIWANYDPKRPSSRVFVDGRLDLHREHLKSYETLKRGMRDGDSETWRPAFEKLGISHVLLNIDPIADRLTFMNSFRQLRRTNEWELMHLDSTTAALGWAEMPEGHSAAADAARIQEITEASAQAAYHRASARLPEPPPPVRPPSFVDWFWRSRKFAESEAILAGHLLNPHLTIVKDPNTPGFNVPTENCYLAIRAARRGLAKRHQVAPQGYVALSEAYFYLYNVELAQLPMMDAHELRTLQLLCALNQLVAADPKNKAARVQLAFRYLLLRYRDLAHEHLEAAIKLFHEDEELRVVLDGGQVQVVGKNDLIRVSEQITIDIERATNELIEHGAELGNPLARTSFWLSRDCPGKAIQDLSEAMAMSPGAVNLAPLLASLYLRTGQPGDLDRGAEGELRKLQGMPGAGGLRPGEYEQMLATVKLLQGDYETSRSFFEKAIAETRFSMANALLQSTIADMREDLREGGLLGLALGTNDLVADAARHARLEFQLGMLQLEAGEPTEAARHFQQALVVRKNLVYRPIIALYLERITGEKLDPLDEEMPAQPTAPDASNSPSSPAESPAKPATSDPVPGREPAKESDKEKDPASR